MKFTFPFLLLSFLSCSLAASKSEKQQIVDLAIAGNGLINLDTNTFDLLTSPHRDWSVSVLFTALDTRRRCLPCKLVCLTFILFSAEGNWQTESLIPRGMPWLEHGLQHRNNIGILTSLPPSTLTTDKQYFKKLASLVTSNTHSV